MAKKNKEETKTNKKIILIVITVIAFIGAIIFLIMTIKDTKKVEGFKIEGIDIISNKDILKDTKVDTLDITNQVLYNRDDFSTFNAIINNNSDNDYYIKELYIVFSIDKEEKKILATRNTTIKANDKKVIDISFDSNMLKTTKIDYLLEK